MWCSMPISDPATSEHVSPCGGGGWHNDQGRISCSVAPCMQHYSPSKLSQLSVLEALTDKLPVCCSGQNNINVLLHLLVAAAVHWKLICTLQSSHSFFFLFFVGFILTRLKVCGWIYTVCSVAVTIACSWVELSLVMSHKASLCVCTCEGSCLASAWQVDCYNVSEVS